MPSSSLFRVAFCFPVVLALSAFGQTVAAPRSGAILTQLPGQNAILMGTDWYPEQWPESRWEEDLRLMEAANLKVVRLAEFAWSRMEPSDKYPFQSPDLPVEARVDNILSLMTLDEKIGALGTSPDVPRRPRPRGVENVEIRRRTIQLIFA